MAYGAHKESIQAQQAVPLPQAAPTPAAAPAAPPAGGGGGDALAAALAMAPPSGGLLGPSQRPGEPVTAGLPSGAGPGPERLAIAKPSIASAFERIAYVTGDPDAALLAQIARGYGG